MTAASTWTSASQWQRSGGKAKVGACGCAGLMQTAESMALACLSGGKYTKDDFKDYEKSLASRPKLALKDQVKSKQEYPSVFPASQLKAPAISSQVGGF